MPDITLTITQAGLDALVDAGTGATDAIQVVEIGLSENVVTVSPTITALPGEFKRLDTFAGQSVSETIIHMTAQDPSTDTYDLRAIALYLADGTLFAVYAQETPIFSKVAIASFLFAFDVAFDQDVSADITFGDANFLWPPASETVKGVAEIATQAETNAGLDDQRIVTPLKLATVLDAVRTALEDADAALAAEFDAIRPRPGDIKIVVTPEPPPGYLKCNGAAVSRTTYADLFAEIGTFYGPGNGSTTFNLPDARGEFLRGWDDGRGVDAGRVLGSWQADELKAHTHPETRTVDGGSGYPGGDGGSLLNTDTGSTGGDETRPRNIAVLFCIKT